MSLVNTLPAVPDEDREKLMAIIEFKNRSDSHEEAMDKLHLAGVPGARLISSELAGAPRCGTIAPRRVDLRMVDGDVRGSRDGVGHSFRSGHATGLAAVNREVIRDIELALSRRRGSRSGAAWFDSHHYERQGQAIGLRGAVSAGQFARLDA